ncbi:Eco57I restriction-modification methylase domain-containing protein [Candidatus Palauibacter sp.]|uniref:Eco57I restriction-modification methylase domain-containing protein n=1 Tax=Candidatus Palauibacter sp. TaxID=3101350 RepID=UPI003B52EC8F
MTVQQESTRRIEAGSRESDVVGMPLPKAGERPALYADRVGEWYVSRKSARHRKDHGLYLTPVPVADFMAGKIAPRTSRVRVLDPAAGAGVLCCSAIEFLVSRDPLLEHVEVVAFEIDEDLIAPLQAVLTYLVDWVLESCDLKVAVRVEAVDFVLANAEGLGADNDLFTASPRDPDFDIVISNPPYFKISKTDPRAVAASSVVHGQPNIYALFMAVSATLLRDGGSFVFIVPRSFASGPYFQRFRSVFFDQVRPAEIHLFESRRAAFRRDEVLQESVIFAGLRESGWHRSRAAFSIAVSASAGVDDLSHADQRTVPANKILDITSRDRILRLSPDKKVDEIIALVDSWPNNLQRLGLNISTGRVVPFRARSLIRRNGSVPATHVPLLWMNHVRAMRTTWPLNRHKPEYIAQSGAGSLLLPNGNYVLLRRFSAKEEPRRLTAAPYLADDLAVPAVGFENHLNYIHRPGGVLSSDETWGLAALFNSQLLDTYFRAMNGNTQVSATEIRAMPLPSRETIRALGKRARRLPSRTSGLEALVATLLQAPVDEGDRALGND